MRIPFREDYVALHISLVTSMTKHTVTFISASLGRLGLLRPQHSLENKMDALDTLCI